jgi:hypothetical protein
MILIISSLNDEAHVDFVTEELRRRDLGYWIFDPASYPLDSEIVVESTARGPAGRIECGKATLDLATVTGAWYRRPGLPIVSSQMDGAEAEWMSQECIHALRGLYEFIPVERWISHPTNIQRASSKIWQLRVAEDIGFRVPPYLLTNDPDKARAFLVAYQRNVVAKALAEPFVLYRDRAEVVVMYTQLLRDVEDLDLAHVKNGPTFFQQYVHKAVDVRVTVVGGEVFAVEIDPSISPEAIVDFRVVDIFDLKHRVVRLPAQLEDACLTLTRRLGLLFGAIDLIKGPDGAWYFLEINPNGQWMWLEWATGVPIREALCDRLSGESKSGGG